MSPDISNGRSLILSHSWSLQCTVLSFLWISTSLQNVEVYVEPAVILLTCLESFLNDLTLYSRYRSSFLIHQRALSKFHSTYTFLKFLDGTSSTAPQLKRVCPCWCQNLLVEQSSYLMESQEFLPVSKHLFVLIFVV